MRWSRYVMNKLWLFWSRFDVYFETIREWVLIPIDNLFEQIYNWDYDYIEQELCLDLINRYREGERYVREEYY